MGSSCYWLVFDDYGQVGALASDEGNALALAREAHAMGGRHFSEIVRYVRASASPILDSE